MRQLSHRVASTASASDQCCGCVDRGGPEGPAIVERRHEWEHVVSSTRCSSNLTCTIAVAQHNRSSHPSHPLPAQPPASPSRTCAERTLAEPWLVRSSIIEGPDVMFIELLFELTTSLVKRARLHLECSVQQCFVRRHVSCPNVVFASPVLCCARLQPRIGALQRQGFAQGQLAPDSQQIGVPPPITASSSLHPNPDPLPLQPR